MIFKQELVKKIRDYFDLNIYETKVWMSLLTRGMATAGEIAETSGVPRSRTYDVLESLEKAGFAIEKIGKPVKYMAVKPEVVIEKLKNNAMRNAEERMDVLANLKDTNEYTELQDLHENGIKPIKQGDMSASIKGRSNLYTQVFNTLGSAEESVYIAMPKKELLSKEKSFSNVFQKLNKRKVDVKLMIPDSKEDAEKLSKKFKVPVMHKDINARFIIVDKAELIFTLGASDASHEDFDNGLWINSGYFANSMAYFFDTAWRN
jgi:HTH-type transcriptional regulator, sugar sensing transcriptional regulator